MQLSNHRKHVIAAVAVIAGMVWCFCGQKTPEKETSRPAHRFTVHATVETEPVHSTGDAADDMCIWIHPEDTQRSRIIGTDKNEESGGLCVYDLQGALVQFVDDPGPNNVDIRSGFPISEDSTVDIVAASCDRDSTIMLYGVHPDSGTLYPVEAREIKTIRAYGIGMYKSPVSGKFYCFVNDRQGTIEQWHLIADGNGKVDARRVRAFSVSSKTEGCVADDAAQVVYIGEEARGIWKFGAEPDDDTAAGVLIDSIRPDGPLPREDVEGLCLYTTGPEKGYLIASSQGDSSFAVYARSAPHAYIASFVIADGEDIDGAEETDGIDATSVPMGVFTSGLFVVQDGRNPGANQNFKYVPWGVIQTHLDELTAPR
jgi:3-phytase